MVPNRRCCLEVPYLYPYLLRDQETKEILGIFFGLLLRLIKLSVGDICDKLLDKAPLRLRTSTGLLEDSAGAVLPSVVIGVRKQLNFEATDRSGAYCCRSHG